MDTGLFYFHVSMCIKDLGVINPKHKRKTSIRSDKQHNYTLVLKHWMRLKFLIRNEKKNSAINIFNISFPFYTYQLRKKNDSGRD